MKDRVALVTGASYGLGAATAELLASRGALVAVCARTVPDLEQVAEKIEKKGGRAMVAPCDLRDHKQVEQMVVRVVEKCGRLDILVNNAGWGIPPNKPVEEISLEEYDETMASNLKSTFLCVCVTAPIMKKQHYGRIVNVSSFAGRNYARSLGAPYSAAKAGMLGLTRHMAVELGPYGICVNAVAPALMLTKRAKEIWNSFSEEKRQSILSGIPLGRLAEVEEVAAAIAFLASDDASYVNGVCLDVNGGSYMA
jgi:NAD(P)-dependent dehydrogenase (short-subunit alcohol dehydrogenase family)